MNSATDTDSVLEQAQRLADGAAEVPGLSGPRAACLVGRQALELVITDLLAVRGLRPTGGTTRSHLICLAEAFVTAAMSVSGPAAPGLSWRPPATTTRMSWPRRWGRPDGWSTKCAGFVPYR